MNQQPSPSETNIKDTTTSSQKWSRRSFIKTGGLVTAAAGAGLPLSSQLSAQTGGNANLSFFLVGDTHYDALADAPDTLEEHILGVNRRFLDIINNLPGQDLPSEMGGGKVQTPAGVIHVGDMIETGDKGSGALSTQRQETEWKAYVEDYGLTGTDGKLKYPVYEVHGNHDSVNEMNVVIKSMLERNKSRPGVTNISESGLHYSWDWAGIHFVALGIVVGHNDQNLPIGRYKAYDSLQFLKEDLEKNIANSGRPVILLHHIDLVRYSKECSEDSESMGEWSACDVAAYHRTIQGYNISAIFHGHLHALRAEWWDGSDKPSQQGTGIPVFGTRNSGAGGSNRGFFYCTVEGTELIVREMTSLGTRDGWEEGSAKWSNIWKVPVTGRA